MTFRLNPRFQIEPGLLFSFSPAISFEDSKETQFESVTIHSEYQVTQTTKDPNPPPGTDTGTQGGGGTHTERVFTGIKEAHDEFGHDFFRAEGYPPRTI